MSGPQDGATHEPLALSVPIRLGDTVVGWASEALARRLSETPRPHLLLAPLPPEVLGLRSGRRFLLVSQAVITYITSKGGLATAVTDHGAFWTDRPMAQLERHLDPRRFYRLDQSHLVNLARVVELIPWTHQRYRIVFGDPGKTELLVSRDVGRRLRAAVGW